ncbi:MAG: FAD-dependent monooxygenase [Oleiphilaceae bacterium]|nr:FAD-dependent monooxygenase [Oleiphilaceae bacterium]
MSQEFDVVVLGAGMVGATVAIGLAQAGLQVALVDPVPVPSMRRDETPHLRVSAISYASEQILRNLGVWSALMPERLCPYRRLAVNERPPKNGLARLLPDISKWARTEFTADEAGIAHLGTILENDHLQWALHQCIAQQDGIHLFCPTKVDAYHLEGDIKHLELNDGTRISAKLIVGAEGAQSPSRIAAGLGQYSERYEQSAFACTVAYQGAQQDITWQMFRPEGPVAFLPLASVADQCYASLVWYDSPAQVEALKRMPDVELVEALREQFPNTLPPIEMVVARGAFPLFKSHASRYHAKGVVLVGDAAHTINPLAGQGVNLGLMDAAVLIEIVSQAALAGENWWLDALLAKYEKRRRRENQAMMAMMDLFYYGFSNERLPLTILRNIGLGLAQRTGPIKRQVLSYAVGLAGDKPRLAEPR